MVAEEVRNLAAKSADAVKETTDLIEGSIKKAKIGTQIVNETAETLSRMTKLVETIVEALGTIAVASNEQTSGIVQINIGIEQMSEVVQNNSATAEEAAASAQELSGQAALLQRMVGQFKLKDENGQIRMLSNAIEIPRRTINLEPNGNGNDNAQIILNDSEFGKY